MKAKKANEHIISFRVNCEERNALLQQAEKHGINLSQFMRKKLFFLMQDNCN